MRRLIRFAKLVLSHPRMPRWIAWLLGVCLLIPGPVDEVLAAPVIAVLLIARRDVLAECWKESAL